MAFIALISSSIWELTEWACTAYESISQEHIAMLTETLPHALFNNSLVFMKIQKDFLAYLGMPISTCSTEIVETDIKPLVDIFVNSMVIIADLFWCFFLLKSFYFCGCSILIGSANVEYVVPLESFEASIDISG